MDNLAHSLFAAGVGMAFSPETARKQRGRLLLASIATANLPDIDILLAAFGREFYMYQHRGFTHSVTGLLLMLPLATYIVRKILDLELSPWSLPKTFAFALLQICVSHLWLDYLTAYGTMLLYPLMERFSYPLMFIIDPFFWLCTGLTFALGYFRQSPNAWVMRLRIFAGWTTILLLWGSEYHYKKAAESIYSNQFPSRELSSYPGPLAPMVWTLLSENPKGNELEFHQGIVNFSKEGDQTLRSGPVPANYYHDRICPKQIGNPEALQHFEKYRQWGEKVACREQTLGQRQGCLCYSLKYSLIFLGYEGFGAYFIDDSGQTSIETTSRIQAVLSLLKT